MGGALGKLGIHPLFLLGQIVNILILFVALRVFLWKPIMQRIEERREMLRQQREDAEAAEEARAEIEEERSRVLEEARDKARGIVADARERADNLQEQAIQEAEKEADRIVEEARQEAEEERNRVLGQMRGQIAALATAAAQRIIGTELDEQRQRALVDSFFSGVREGEVEVLPEKMKRPPDGRVTVTSAIPLTGAEEDIIRKELMDRVDGDIDVAFRVDPEVMGGLVVRAGDRVVDGSVVGQLERLQETLV